jgi:hypothetical protein
MLEGSGMKLFCAAAVIALMAGPAFAQDTHVHRYGEPPVEKSTQEIAADKAADQAYKRSLGNIPDQAPVDPWGNARSADAPKTAAKAAPAKRAKTGSTAN